MSVLINDNAARTPVRRRRVAGRPVTISLATLGALLALWWAATALHW